jgi:hypothetical protein
MLSAGSLLIMKTETKNCQNCKNDFVIEPDDFGFYEKMKVPVPTFCPDCRFQRRLLFRNNRVFYRRECAMCKKSMLSVYNKNKAFIIYCRECWLSDKWNPLDHGMEYDFSRPFFEQFLALQKAVPRANLYQTNFISSEYCNYGLDFKECYLLFGGYNNERVYFGNQIFDSKDSMDIAFSDKVEFSYGLFECQRTNKLFFSHYCTDCVESMYLVDCRNCINCFGCVGLVNKQYYIFNQPHTREQYLEFLKSNKQGSFKSHVDNLRKLESLRKAVPHRYARVYKSINSDGDDLLEVRNTHSSFSSREAENSKFLFFCKHGSKDCYDVSFLGFNSELAYENCHGFGGHNAAFGVRNFANQNMRYSEDCHDCQNIFGCEGLRKQNYCILNKQYSKEEYEALVPKITKHMTDMPYINKRGKTYSYGEFFPIELSPFSYNETIAQEYFPLTKEDAMEKNYEWEDSEERNYNIDITTENIQDEIQDVNEDILNKIIQCEHAGRCKDQCTEAFKIVAEELKFLKRMSLPLPRLCPNCRNYQLLNLRNPLKLWDRKCMCDKEGHFHDQDKCVVEFKTSYAPDRPEVIFCEKCYQQEIY